MNDRPSRRRPSSADNPSATLERLLQESATLRTRSEALAAEVEELRRRIQQDGGWPAPAPVERRRKPRLGGK